MRQSPGSAKIDHLPAAGSYTPHIYGPGVRENAPEFRSASFPENMPHIWDRRFGNIVAHNCTRATPALVLGEWGGEVEGTNQFWMRTLFNYLRRRHMNSNFFWHLGMGGQPAGLVIDWTRDDVPPVIDTRKLRVLRKLVPHPTRIPKYGEVGLKPEPAFGDVPDGDTSPSGTVLCAGQSAANYCDCGGDCADLSPWCACPEAQAASCCNNAEPNATEEAEGTSGRSTPPQPEDAAQTQAPVPLDEDPSETAHTSAGDEPDDAKEEDLCPGHPHILRSSATCESKLAHESKRRGKTPARH